MMKFSLPTAFGKKVSLVIGLVVLSAFQAQAFDKAHREKLLSTNDCKECNLRGAYLGGADLSQATLPKAGFSGANLTGANFKNERMLPPCGENPVRMLK